MIKKIFLTTLLFSAGIIHLYTPEVFISAVPNFLIFKKEIVLITGIIEIILAIGILLKKFQYKSAEFTAYYFILLIPVHIYVAYNSIEMFGVNNQYALWIRTLLQYPLILLAYSLTKNPWVIEQVWKKVFFIHYKIDPKLIESKIPFKLDLYEGQAILSIIPFYMDKIRFPFLPAIPKISSLWEINLRTYVEVNGIKGIYFLTLEADSKLAVFIANTFFFLPYRFAKISANIKNNTYEFIHKREDIQFHLKAEIISNEIKSSDFDLWAAERYNLFTKNSKNEIYHGIVIHEPWKLKDVKVNDLNNQFTTLITNKILIDEKCHYSDKLKVRFKPFKKINEIRNN